MLSYTALSTALYWLLWPLEILLSPQLFLSGLTGIAAVFGLSMVWLAGFALTWFYFLPSCIVWWRGVAGLRKGRARLVGMIVLNLLFGWTGFGWLCLFAMAWALRPFAMSARSHSRKENQEVL